MNKLFYATYIYMKQLSITFGNQPVPPFPLLMQNGISLVCPVFHTVFLAV